MANQPTGGAPRRHPTRRWLTLGTAVAWSLAAPPPATAQQAAEVAPREATAEVDASAPGADPSESGTPVLTLDLPGPVEIREIEVRDASPRLRTRGFTEPRDPDAIRTHGLGEPAAPDRIRTHGPQGSLGSDRIRTRGLGAELSYDEIPSHGVEDARTPSRIRTHGIADR